MRSLCARSMCTNWWEEPTGLYKEDDRIGAVRYCGLFFEHLRCGFKCCRRSNQDRKFNDGRMCLFNG